MTKNIFGGDIVSTANFYHDLAVVWRNYEDNEVTREQLVKCIWIICGERCSTPEEATELFNMIGRDDDGVPHRMDEVPNEFRPHYASIVQYYENYKRLNPGQAGNIQTIKYIRDKTGVGLKVAKDFFDQFIHED